MCNHWKVSEGRCLSIGKNFIVSVYRYNVDCVCRKVYVRNRSFETNWILPLLQLIKVCRRRRWPNDPPLGGRKSDQWLAIPKIRWRRRKRRNCGVGKITLAAAAKIKSFKWWLNSWVLYLGFISTRNYRISRGWSKLPNYHYQLYTVYFTVK